MQKVCRRRAEGAQNVCGRCVHSAWKVHGKCAGGAWNGRCTVLRYMEGAETGFFKRWWGQKMRVLSKWGCYISNVSRFFHKLDENAYIFIFSCSKDENAYMYIYCVKIKNSPIKG